MPEAPTVDDDVELIDHVLAILASLGIVEIVYGLSGGGDSGDTSLDSVTYADERVEYSLPVMPVSFHITGQPMTLESFMEDHAAELPEENWCDNDGGSGCVTYRPTAVDPSERIECSMSFNDEDDDDCGDDDVDLGDVDLIGDDDDDEDLVEEAA